MFRGKKYKDSAKQIDRSVQYDPADALGLVCKTASAKFDETVEIHIRLGVDSRHADQQVRGAIVLPNGTGKTRRVLVFAKDAKADEAKAAGADYVGGMDMVERIQKEKDAAGGGQAARADDESDRPCERSKWLWLLWFFKNLMLIESVLRYVHLVHASMSAAGIEELEEILTKSDYLMELRIGQPEEWLKIVVQTAWNTGMPLIPLRNIQTIRKVLEWNRVHPIPG